MMLDAPDTSGGRRAAAAALLLFAAGCRENTYVPPPPPTVTVARPVRQEVVTFHEFTGRTEACEWVEIRARVPGFLEQIHFVEGVTVEAGDLLYTIEQAPYEAALQAARAELASIEAKLAESLFEFEKMKNLREQEAASDQEYVVAEASYERDLAAKLAAEAAITSAELDLGYTTIRAPISGHINRSLVDQGNLVGQGSPTVLTTIVRWDPMHVYFTIGERDALEFRRRQAAEDARDYRGVPVYIRLADGTDYSGVGRIDYADNRVDPATGTVRVRAVFENPGELLLPGIFVRVRIPGIPGTGLLVPESALQRDLGGYFLLAVDPQGAVARQDVRVGELVGSVRVIESGLAGDERVIIRGIQRARPGIRVEAQEGGFDPGVTSPGGVSTGPATTAPAGGDQPGGA